MELLLTLLAFVVALGVLVTVHEYGHYRVARGLGVKILRFSVGFGRPIWRRQAQETEFVVAAIPLGGYVKMLDEREGEVAPHELDRAFNRQSLGTRTAVVAAGPLANFALAFLAYWLMLVLGITGPKPIIGEVAEGKPAARAGLEAGAEILAVDGEPTHTWDGVFRRSLGGILDGRKLNIVFRNAAGGERVGQLDFANTTIDDIGKGDFFGEVGITPKRPTIPPRLAKVVAGEPAADAGLQSGDLIHRADGIRIESWFEWVEYVRARPNVAINLDIMRGDILQQLVLTPRTQTDGDTTVGRIGAEVEVPDVVEPVARGIERFGPIEAISGAASRTLEMSSTTLKFLYKMVTGQASVENLSGPISIAHYAGESARMGLPHFLEFLALVSVSLGVLNLLPIPLLDGGHLLYYLIEFATRRPVSESVQIFGQQIGLLMLLSLMGLAVYNDIMRML